jgi:ubiquinone/menaquinone biosynthesis C-methylase UbiE
VTDRASSARAERARRLWDRRAADYDARISGTERRWFRDTRSWLCRHARGDTLEVAIGTGLNLPHYPPDVRLTGLDASTGMTAVAARRARDLGRPLELHQGDAGALPFPDARFDTVVCTFALCGVPDVPAAVSELVRVVRPGGGVLIADHVASTFPPLRLLQAVTDLVTVPWHGEHFGRRPLAVLRAADVVVDREERFALGTVERVVAHRTPAG